LSPKVGLSYLEIFALVMCWLGFSWPWLDFVQTKAKHLSLGLGSKLGLTLALAWPWLRPWIASKISKN